MITAWRIDKAGRSKQNSFSGNGAAITGGRWNQAGTRTVYAAESLSLAAMEKFVHLGDEGRALRLVAYRVDIPADLRIDELKRKELPPDWKAVPAPQSTKKIGDDWVNKASSPAFKVPSVVIETEHNYLFNPLHPDFKRLKISDPEPFQLDSRMWRG